MAELGTRIQQIDFLIGRGLYPIAAKECAVLLEYALRELLLRQHVALAPADRRGVHRAELEIGKGVRGLEDFGLGQLVGVLRESGFFEAWSRATGKSLGGLALVNLNSLVDLRNKLMHEDYVASRSDAEILFAFLKLALETFGILALEEPHATPTRATAPAFRQSPPGPDEMPDAEARSRIQEILGSERFRWRSLATVGKLTGLPEERVLAIVRKDPEVEVSVGKSGRTIAGLRSRIGGLRPADVDLGARERSSMDVKVRCAQVHGFDPESLEGTLSNPRYSDDLAALDDVWGMSRVMSSETILVVTGCSLVAELLDRPVAEALRDEIDRRGGDHPFRRAIVLGDRQWYSEEELHSHPVISVGGSPANSLTRELVEDPDGPEDEGELVFQPRRPPRLAVWGRTADRTRALAERLSRDPVLEAFLALAWPEVPGRDGVETRFIGPS